MPRLETSGDSRSYRNGLWSETTVEAVLKEGRLTRCEITLAGHESRIAKIEADAILIRAAVWSFTRAVLVLLAGIALDQAAGGGVVSGMLKRIIAVSS
jgi:hypothetical protein